MKVGIYSGNSPEIDGGAYTFSQVILDGIIKFGSKLDHQFVFFYYDKDDNEFYKEGLKFVEIQKTEFSFYRKMSNRIIRVFWDKAHSIHLERFSNSVNENKIDCFWFINHYQLIQNIPFIYTLFDLQPFIQPFFPELSVLDAEQFYSPVLKRAAYIITGTNRGRLELKNIFGIIDERIKIIPLPTPDIPDLKIDKNKYKLPFKLKDYFLYPAQFWAHKNHILILHAVQILKELYNVKINVVFCGSDKGNLRYIQQKITELNLIEQVKLIGFIEREYLYFLYKNALALIFPSLFGPDNLPPLEAFAFGCPVLASNLPGVEEQLGSSAILFNPADENDLAQKILYFLQHPEVIEKLISLGLERSSTLSVKNYLYQLNNLLNDFSKLRRTWPT